MKNEMLALILAGGQGTRLGKLTKNIAKPAVQFGGRYRIIDFALSNCANSGIHNVGVITQYQPLALNSHIEDAHQKIAFTIFPDHRQDALIPVICINNL